MAEETKPPSTEKPVTKPAPVVVPSEDEINSPDWLTLGFLGAIFVVTAGSWGAARFACNMHPPESHAAPKTTTERLIQTPKDAAIEFIQRFRSSDFDGALDVSAGDLQSEVRASKAECDSHANDCARKREAAAGRLTTAILVSQDAAHADARVTTTLKGQTEAYEVAVSREGTVWKAVAKKPL